MVTSPIDDCIFSERIFTPVNRMNILPKEDILHDGKCKSFGAIGHQLNFLPMVQVA